MRVLVLVFLLFYGTAYATVSDEDRVKTLSLDDAILLSLRHSPTVKIDHLDYISQKFSLWVREWEFLPQYNFEANVTASKNRHNKIIQPGSSYYNLSPGASIKSHYGTTVTLSGTNTNQGHHYNPGLQLSIVQPLMRGFGKPVVDAALMDARQNEYVKRLSIESDLRGLITDVIGAYLDVVSGEETVRIDNDALKRAEKSLEQTKLFVKAGHKAGNEIVSVSANVATSKATLENDKNSLQQKRYALLTIIGLDPNTPVKFVNIDLKNLIAKYQLPSLVDTKRLALENDINYQTEVITLNGSLQRDLLIAKDNMRPQLNATATLSTGQGAGGGFNAGVNSLVNGYNQGKSITLSFIMPIDDQRLKQGLLNAKLAIKRAEINLQKDRWNKETSAINGWNGVMAAKRRLGFAEDAEVLQQKTYKINYQKYLHGLIDSLELQTAQDSLIEAQRSLLEAMIAYLKSLVDLDKSIGHTLQTWHIPVRY